MTKKRKPGRCVAGGRWIRHINGDQEGLRLHRYCPHCGRYLKTRLSKSGKAVQLPGHNTRSPWNKTEVLAKEIAVEILMGRFWLEDVETMKARVRRVKSGGTPSKGTEQMPEQATGTGRRASRKLSVEERKRIEETQQLWEDVNQFLDRARRCGTTFSFRRYVRDRYVQVFGEQAPEVHPALIHAAVGYQLQYMSFERLGRTQDLSPVFMRRRDAALTLDLSKYHEEDRGLMEITMRVVGDGQVSENHISRRAKMATKKTTKKTDGKGSSKGNGVGRGIIGETSGLNQSQFWMKLFTDNAKLTQAKGGRKTDAQLSEVMQAEFPRAKQTEVKHIVMHRRLFNQGRIRGQEAAPSQPSVPYDEQGKPLPLPTRGGRRSGKPETQAKAKGKAKGKAAQALARGTRVYTDEFGSDFPGKVTGVADGQVSVLFDDGDEGEYPAGEVHRIVTKARKAKARKAVAK